MFEFRLMVSFPQHQSAPCQLSAVRTSCWTALHVAIRPGIRTATTPIESIVVEKTSRAVSNEVPTTETATVTMTVSESIIQSASFNPISTFPPSARSRQSQCSQRSTRHREPFIRAVTVVDRSCTSCRRVRCTASPVCLVWRPSPAVTTIDVLPDTTPTL